MNCSFKKSFTLPLLALLLAFSWRSLRADNETSAAAAGSVASTGTDDGQPDAPFPPPPGYHLVWADEFSNEPDGPPDPAKWIYEEGFIRNNEAQYYTKGRLENARVENGALVLEARKEDFPNPTTRGPRVAHYTSAALETYGKADWQYGRIEVKAKLPAGKGVWPAIWTLGVNEKDKSVGWPRCGEIDIMELFGRAPNVIDGTMHYFAKGGHQSLGKPVPADHPESRFNVYAVEWTPDYVDFFFNHRMYFHFDTKAADNAGSNPYQKPHYLILNFALGGGGGGPIDNSIFPQRMTIDYVRVYQKSPPSP